MKKFLIVLPLLLSGLANADVTEPDNLAPFGKVCSVGGFFFQQGARFDPPEDKIDPQVEAILQKTHVASRNPLDIDRCIGDFLQVRYWIEALKTPDGSYAFWVNFYVFKDYLDDLRYINVWHKQKFSLAPSLAEVEELSADFVLRSTDEFANDWTSSHPK